MKITSMADFVARWDLFLHFTDTGEWEWKEIHSSSNCPD